ncbi:hypothetical protein [Streptacidiphilus neutrinimicus]|uniref:hypothetical protein n=1 Tax=Streptacidiphilus neutrinimicus TaxID=105420 RepID=UPI0006934751|nr:hypothetical protein [Streptacidiphilus neutrinimicus]
MTTKNTPRRAELVKYTPEQPGRLTCAWQRVQPWLEARYWDLEGWAVYKAGPWIGRRFRDIERALEGGWSGTVAWIRAVLGLVAFAILVTGAVWLEGLALGFWRHTMIGTHHSGVLATVTRPVHTYIDQHAAGLPVSAATVWALWQLAGPILVSLACIGSTTARLLWIAYGAAWTAMVWANTPAPGQAVATALAAVCWAAVSSPALSGLDPRPVLLIPVRVRIRHKAATLRAQQPAPQHAGQDENG